MSQKNISSAMARLIDIKKGGTYVKKFEKHCSSWHNETKIRETYYLLI